MVLESVAVVDERKILVLGLGVSGYAAAELAVQCGAQVVVLDASSTPELQDRAGLLASRGVDVRLEWNDSVWDGHPDLAVISPGIHLHSTLGQLAMGLGCPVISELEYGFRHCSCPILAVTGTNGKTTTVELLVHCLRHARHNVLAAGNIGNPLCAAARRCASLDFLVVEVSSFQLERIERFAPLAAALLNITPDHMDRYTDFDEYLRTKLRILANMRTASRIVLRDDLLQTESVLAALPAGDSSPVRFSASEDSVADFFLSAGGKICCRRSSSIVELVPRSALRLKGRHNVENALAALALAEAAGVPCDDLAPHLVSFVPTPHRLELAAVHNGVQFINDSKSTNPDALRRALVTVGDECDGRLLLIAGGDDKGLDFTSLADLLRQAVADVFLIGRSRQRLAQQWGGVVSCKMFMSLAAAVDAAVDSVRPGDTVLLSPGCSSKDMFADYAERGREFCTLVKRRTGE